MEVDVDCLVADTERCLAELELVGGLERFDRSLIPRSEWLAEPVEGEPHRSRASRDARGARGARGARPEPGGHMIAPRAARLLQAYERLFWDALTEGRR